MKRILLAWMMLAVTLTGIGKAQASDSPSLEGRWTGTLGAAPNQLRLVVDIVRAFDGLMLGSVTSVDQGNAVIPIDAIEQSGNSIKLTINSVGATFEGSLTQDGRVKGIWSQGAPLPLEFVRAPADPATALPMASPPAQAAPAPIQAQLTLPFAPTPVRGDGKTRLSFELYINNQGAGVLQLTRLDVLSADAPIASYKGAELNGLLVKAGAPSGLDKRVMEPGGRAVAFLWVTLDAGKPVPKSLRARLTARTGQTIETAATALPIAKPIRLSPPLSGDNWLASSGPGSMMGHRQAVALVDNKPVIAQRFAIDWLQYGADGALFKGDPKDNRSYRGYGAEALAAADATVSAIKDGIPENIPGPTSRAVPITNETIGGNHVILDLGQGRFAFYAHLQPGSLKVKLGDKVKRGQVLGLVGNSGNSTAPHLHFHVVNGNSPLMADGLPYVIDSFEVQDKPGGPWKMRRDEIPMNNAKVRFKPRR